MQESAIQKFLEGAAFPVGLVGEKYLAKDIALRLAPKEQAVKFVGKKVLSTQLDFNEIMLAKKRFWDRFDEVKSRTVDSSAIINTRLEDLTEAMSKVKKVYKITDPAVSINIRKTIKYYIALEKLKQIAETGRIDIPTIVKQIGGMAEEYIVGSELVKLYKI